MDTIDLVVYIGIFVFACTGALKARAYHMDIFGGVVMAFAMAFGGGTCRDLLIGQRPVNWINDDYALILVCCATIITFIFKRRIIKFWYIPFLTDALGLGLYTYTGIERSQTFNIDPPYMVLMGVVTATFGGLIADIISNTVPSLLKRGELYATASAIGGAIYVTLMHFGINKDVNMILCIFLVFVIRVFSKWKKISLPEI